GRRRRLQLCGVARTGGRGAAIARPARTTAAGGRHGRIGRELRSMTVARSARRSHEIMERARELFPGGVSSPVRAFRGVGGEPFVVDRGEGARIWDVDGNEYLDFVLSWGALALG